MPSTSIFSLSLSSPAISVNPILSSTSYTGVVSVELCRTGYVMTRSRHAASPTDIYRSRVRRSVWLSVCISVCRCVFVSGCVRVCLGAWLDAAVFCYSQSRSGLLCRARAASTNSAVIPQFTVFCLRQELPQGPFTPRTDVARIRT